MTDNNKSIVKELLAVQKELSKKALKKSGSAQYGKYVLLNTVIDEVLPVLNEHGILLTQFVTTKQDQPALRTRLDMGGEEYLEDTMFLELKSPDPQAQGSAITYARRYSLMSILGLVGEDEDDDGNAATTAASSTPRTTASIPQPKLTVRNPEEPMTEAQKKLMLTTIGRKGFNEEDAHTILARKAGVEGVDDIKRGVASTLIDELFKAKAEELATYLEGGNDAEAN